MPGCLSHKNYEPMRLCVILSFLLFSLCSWSGKEQKTIKASGRIVTEERLAKAFTAIAVSEGINLYLSCGDSHSITVKTDDNILPYLKTEVQGNTLKIYFPEDIQVKAHGSSEVYVTLPQLEELTASTGAMIKSNQLIQAKNIELKASTSGLLTLDLEAIVVKVSATTSGDIYLKGKADKLDAQLSMNGNLNAADFPVKFANIKETSGSKATLDVSEQLEFYVREADLIYKGDPEIISHKLRGANITKMIR